MPTLDQPTQFEYKNGNIFPPNLLIMSYILLPIALGVSFKFIFFIGIPLFFLALCVAVNQHIVHIPPENGILHDYVRYIGFIKMGKKIQLDKYRYITAMPLIESSQVYGRSSNSITISNSFHAVTIFGNRLRGKRFIKKFDTRLEASSHAKQISETLNIEYFEYDPKLVREIMLG